MAALVSTVNLLNPSLTAHELARQLLNGPDNKVAMSSPAEFWGLAPVGKAKPIHIVNYEGNRIPVGDVVILLPGATKK